MSAWRMLDWDTEFFGFPVAIITEPAVGSLALVAMLTRLRQEGVRLVYWPAPEELPAAALAKLQRDFGAFLADRKTMFLTDLDGKAAADLAPETAVVPYAPSMPREDLMGLAVQTGEQSRFASDPGIPRAKYEALYKNWMNNALAGEMADAVLVVQDGRRIVGMVTMEEKSGRGDIGLIAVEQAQRGRGFGVALVRAAQRWTLQQGLRYAQVCTQGDNAAACRLYRKCGYDIESVQYYYHFWL